MHVEREWLANYSWDFVTAQNAMLCEAKSALHKPTSDAMSQPRLYGRVVIVSQ